VVSSGASTGDPNCQTASNGICLQCYLGFYVNQNTGICGATNPICLTVNGLNACTSCYSGYTLSNGNCIISGGVTNLDPNCAQFQNGQCISCSSRSYMTPQGCTLVDPECQVWTAYGICTKCYSGYTVLNGGCILQTQTPVITQTICYYRQVLISGVCVQVNGQCQTWSSVTALCTSCYVGYTLQSGACILWW
jgi:hypothetical protein